MRSLGSNDPRPTIPCRRLPQMVCGTTSKHSRDSTAGHRRLYEPEALGRPQPCHSTQRVEQLKGLLSSRREPWLVPGRYRERHSINALATLIVPTSRAGLEGRSPTSQNDARLRPQRPPCQTALVTVRHVWIAKNRSGESFADRHRLGSESLYGSQSQARRFSAIPLEQSPCNSPPSLH